jgi:hypothetical protein
MGAPHGDRHLRGTGWSRGARFLESLLFGVKTLDMFTFSPRPWYSSWQRWWRAARRRSVRPVRARDGITSR